MSGVISVARVVEILENYSLITVESVIEVLNAVTAQSPGDESDPAWERGRQDCAGAVGNMADNTAIIDAIIAEVEALAFPQKAGVGLQGGATTKIAAKRAKERVREAIADKKEQKKEAAWFEKAMKDARERTKKFGAANGGLKTGKLTTGKLTTGDLARRVHRNHRLKK